MQNTYNINEKKKNTTQKTHLYAIKASVTGNKQKNMYFFLLTILINLIL